MQCYLSQWWSACRCSCYLLAQPSKEEEYHYCNIFPHWSSISLWKLNVFLLVTRLIPPKYFKKIYPQITDRQRGIQTDRQIDRNIQIYKITFWQTQRLERNILSELWNFKCKRITKQVCKVYFSPKNSIKPTITKKKQTKYTRLK